MLRRRYSFGDGPVSNFHVRAYAEAGRGAAVCAPVRVFDTGDVATFGGVLAAPVVAGDTLLVLAENTTAIDTTTVVSGHSATGRRPRTERVLAALYSAPARPPPTESATPPAVAGDVVFVGPMPSHRLPDVGQRRGCVRFNLGGCGTGREVSSTSVAHAGGVESAQLCRAAGVSQEGRSSTRRPTTTTITATFMP